MNEADARKLGTLHVYLAARQERATNQQGTVDVTLDAQELGWIVAGLRMQMPAPAAAQPAAQPAPAPTDPEAEANLETILKAWAQMLGLPLDHVRADFEQRMRHSEFVQLATSYAAAVLSKEGEAARNVYTRLVFAIAAAVVVRRNQSFSAAVGEELKRISSL